MIAPSVNQKAPSTGFTSAYRPKADSMHDRGMSMIELLVVITIVAIFASIAVPGFGSMLATNDMNNAQENIASMLRKARSLAVSRGTIATVTMTAANNTSVLTLADGSNPSETITLPSSVSLGANATYTFSPDGTATTGNTALTAPNYASIPARNMTVTATGQINVSR